jgi:hypothetical protein
MPASSQPEPPSEYLMANAAPEAGLRFDSLAALFNPGTFRHMDRLGIRDGWRCWEVGVGGPTIPAWLADRVGPTGRVLATDIDIRWARSSAPPNVEVREHDVAHDDPPLGQFDLVHERLVLIHVPERVQAIERMVAALRPGGWLLLEDFDSTMQPDACPDEFGQEQARANRIRGQFRELLAQRGADLALGRRLPRLLRDAGLVDVAADAYLSIALPGGIGLEQANVAQVRDAFVERAGASADEIDQHLDALAAGRLDMATAPLVSAWGRKPPI